MPLPSLRANATQCVGSLLVPRIDAPFSKTGAREQLTLVDLKLKRFRKPLAVDVPLRVIDLQRAYFSQDSPPELDRFAQLSIGLDQLLFFHHHPEISFQPADDFFQA